MIIGRERLNCRCLPSGSVWVAQPRLAVPRRVMADAAVTEGGYMRVHLHPKRFHAVYTTDWKVRRL